MKRGPKSTAELATRAVSVSGRGEHPAPCELTDAQADVWRATIAGMSGREWLSRSAYPILIEYCRHVCRARLIERQIAKFDTDWTKVEGGLERLDRLLAMAERETRTITACARSLRLTPQAQMHARTAATASRNASTGRKPWD